MTSVITSNKFWVLSSLTVGVLTLMLVLSKTYSIFKQLQYNSEVM